MIYFKSKSLTITNYADVSIVVSLKDPTTNQPINIRGCTLFLNVKKNRADVASSMQLQQSGHFDAENGISILKIMKANSQSLAAGTYIYDLKMQTQSGDLIDLYQSDLHVEQSIKTS